MRYKYNLKPSRYDSRDYKLRVLSQGSTIVLMAAGENRILNPFQGQTLPDVVDNRPHRGKPRDQGNVGRCTGFGTTNAVRTLCNLHGYKFPYTGSADFQYYNEQVKLGTVGTDSGSDIGTALNVMTTIGICPEDSSPAWSCPTGSTMRVDRPSDGCYLDASKHKLIKYYQLELTRESIMAALAAGFTIVGGIMVYRSMESSQCIKTGDIPMPGILDRLMGPVGGHCMSFDGYHKADDLVYVENSWGASVGENGGFTIPFDYLTNSNYTIDLRAIGLVT